jgi:hypothetical protein
MRLEVRTLGKGLGFSRENLAVYDADYGNFIEGVQDIQLKFGVGETGELKLTVFNRGDRKTFSFDEDQLYASEGRVAIKHVKSGRFLSGVIGFDIDTEKNTLTVTISDFDVDMKILRPHKEYGRNPEGTKHYV